MAGSICGGCEAGGERGIIKAMQVLLNDIEFCEDDPGPTSSYQWIDQEWTPPKSEAGSG